MGQRTLDTHDVAKASVPASGKRNFLERKDRKELFSSCPLRNSHSLRCCAFSFMLLSGTSRSNSSRDGNLRPAPVWDTPPPNIGWRLFPLGLHAHGYPVSHRPGKQRRNSPSKTSPTGAQTGMQSVIPHFAMTNWSGETRANRQ